MRELLLAGPISAPFVFLALSLVGVGAVEVAARRSGASADGALLRRWILGIGLWALAVVLSVLIVPEPLGGPRLLERWGAVPVIVQFVVLLAATDLLQALIHRVLHRVPVLWRLHAIHHADRTYGVPTALRFHPLETLLRSFAQAGLLAVLGPDGAALMAVIVVDTCWNVFEHAGFDLPPRIERALAAVFVTPGVHRVHHAAAGALHETNFATVFTLWDRAMGTYHPPVGSVVPVGLARWESGDDLVDNLLAPWREPRDDSGN